MSSKNYFCNKIGFETKAMLFSLRIFHVICNVSFISGDCCYAHHAVSRPRHSEGGPGPDAETDWVSRIQINR